MRAILLDDEKHALNALTDAIQKANCGINIVGSFSSINEAYHGINDLSPDLLFLDIELGQKTSFDLLDIIPSKAKVIFVSGHNEFAVKAFKYSAVDFIEKPASALDILSAIEKIKQLQSESTIPFLKETLLNQQFDKIALNTGKEIHITSISDIVYLEADERYCNCFLSNGTKLHVNKSLKEFEQFLDEQHFYRVHKSFIIHLHHLVKFENKEIPKVKLSTEKSIPVAHKRRKEFVDYLSNYYPQVNS